MPTFEGAETQILRERRLTDADGAAEQDVLLAAEKLQREQVLVQLAIDRAGMIPIETTQGRAGSQRRLLDAPSEVSGLALPLFEGDELLDELA